VARVQALEAVSAPLLGTVFSMVPASGPRAYAQYNSYYQATEPVQSEVRRPAAAHRPSPAVTRLHGRHGPIPVRRSP